jgi:hypothetical protein
VDPLVVPVVVPLVVPVVDPLVVAVMDPLVVPAPPVGAAPPAADPASSVGVIVEPPQAKAIPAANTAKTFQRSDWHTWHMLRALSKFETNRGARPALGFATPRIC